MLKYFAFLCEIDGDNYTKIPRAPFVKLPVEDNEGNNHAQILRTPLRNW